MYQLSLGRVDAATLHGHAHGHAHALVELAGGVLRKATMLVLSHARCDALRARAVSGQSTVQPSLPNVECTLSSVASIDIFLGNNIFNQHWLTPAEFDQLFFECWPIFGQLLKTWTTLTNDESDTLW